MDVVVVDREGAPVRGLRAEDFTVEEDGRPQALAAFEAVDRPPAAAARTDAGPCSRPRVSSNRGARPGRRPGLRDRLRRPAPRRGRGPTCTGGGGGLPGGCLAGGDRVTLVATSGDGWWHTRMPEGGDALRSILPRLRGRARVADSMREGMTDYEAMRIDRDHDPLVTGHVTRRWKAAATDILSLREDDTVGERVTATAARIGLEVERRNQETLDVLARAFASLAAVRGRKAVLLVSGGFVHDPRLAEFRRALGRVDARQRRLVLRRRPRARRARPGPDGGSGRSDGPAGQLAGARRARGGEPRAPSRWPRTPAGSRSGTATTSRRGSDDRPRVLELLPARLRAPVRGGRSLPPDRGAGGARGRAGAGATGLLPGRGRRARPARAGRGPGAGARLALRPRRDPAARRRFRASARRPREVAGAAHHRGRRPRSRPARGGRRVEGHAGSGWWSPISRRAALHRRDEQIALQLRAGGEGAACPARARRSRGRSALAPGALPGARRRTRREQRAARLAARTTSRCRTAAGLRLSTPVLSDRLRGSPRGRAGAHRPATFPPSATCTAGSRSAARREREERQRSGAGRLRRPARGRAHARGLVGATADHAGARRHAEPLLRDPARGRSPRGATSSSWWRRTKRAAGGPRRARCSVGERGCVRGRMKA